MKRITAVLLAAALLTLSACNRAGEGQAIDLTSNSISQFPDEGTNDSEVSDGGANIAEDPYADEIDYENTLSHGYEADSAMYFVLEYRGDLYGMSGDIKPFVNQEKYETWSKQFEHVSADGKRDGSELNLFNIVKELNVSREDLAKATNYEGNLLFNEEELDAIYDGSEETLSKYFANPYAIVNNGKVYTPKWILTHESEDFEREGITQEMIAEKRMQWESEDLFSYHIGKPNENAPYNYYASVDANMVTTNFDMKWDPECDEFFKEFIEFEDIAVSLVGKDEYASWLEKFKSGGRDMGEYNIITFIREYQIDRFDFNKAAKGMKSLKLERKNTLYYADYDYSLTRLANPYALQHDGKIYTLKWFSKHSAEDYSNEGLPAEEVKAYLKRVESIFVNTSFPEDERNVGFVQASENAAVYELLTQGDSLE